jgi:hypothetical protein
MKIHAVSFKEKPCFPDIIDIIKKYSSQEDLILFPGDSLRCDRELQEVKKLSSNYKSCIVIELNKYLVKNPCKKNKVR